MFKKKTDSVNESKIDYKQVNRERILSLVKEKEASILVDNERKYQEYLESYQKDVDTFKLEYKKVGNFLWINTKINQDAYEVCFDLRDILIELTPGKPVSKDGTVQYIASFANRTEYENYQFDRKLSDDLPIQILLQNEYNRTYLSQYSLESYIKDYVTTGIAQVDQNDVISFGEHFDLHVPCGYGSKILKEIHAALD